MTQRRYYIPEGIYFITTNTAWRIPWFTEDALCRIVMAHIRLNASVKHFTVFSFVVMPDHLHLLLQTLGPNISECMRSLKTNTSRELNRYLRSAGVDTRAAQSNRAAMENIDFRWQRRFYDHVIRSAEDFHTHLNYIIQNPVRAGLVERPEDYPYLFVAPDEVFKDIF